MDKEYQPTQEEINKAEGMMGNDQKRWSDERAGRHYLYNEGRDLLKGGSDTEIFEKYMAEVWDGQLIEGRLDEIRPKLKKFLEENPEFREERIAKVGEQLEKLRELREKNELDSNLHRIAHHILANEIGLLRSMEFYLKHKD